MSQRSCAGTELGLSTGGRSLRPAHCTAVHVEEPGSRLLLGHMNCTPQLASWSNASLSSNMTQLRTGWQGVLG